MVTQKYMQNTLKKERQLMTDAGVFANVNQKAMLDWRSDLLSS